MNMKSFVNIPINSNQIEGLCEQARQHLLDNNISVHIDKIGSEDQKDFFGIVFRRDGDEQWWNDGMSDSQSDVIAWDSEEEALQDLNEYVLPNLVFCLEKERIKTFQMNL